MVLVAYCGVLRAPTVSLSDAGMGSERRQLLEGLQKQPSTAALLYGAVLNPASVAEEQEHGTASSSAPLMRSYERVVQSTSIIKASNYDFNLAASSNIS